MSRTHFFIVTCLSGLVVALLVLQIIFVRMTAYDQARLIERQQIVNEGQSFDLHARQVAARIYQISQQTQDQGLKELLARQQITLAPPTDGGTNTPPAPTPPSH
jgi:hypothetical protein